MSERTSAPSWQVSRWFNTTTALSLEALRGQVVLLHAFQMLCPGCVSRAVPQAEQVDSMPAAVLSWWGCIQCLNIEKQ